MSISELLGEVIATYSRADAIADGVLVDVTEAAKERGFRVPVALTSAVYADCVQWSDADTDRKKLYQEEAGRLGDVLNVAMLTIRTSPHDASRLPFRIARVPREGKAREAQATKLVMTIGPGDNGEPVMTIMEEGED